MNYTFTLEEILTVVLDYYGYTIEDFTRRDRNKHLVNGRQMFFYISACFTKSTLVEKGDILDRDHTTVIYSINKIKIEKEIYPYIKKEIEGVTEMLFKTSKLIVENINLLELTENYTKSFINN